MYEATWDKNKIYQVLFTGAFTCFYIFKTASRVAISVAQGACAKRRETRMLVKKCGVRKEEP